MTARLIGIGGGVGPMAGVELHRRIVEHTRTTGRDQDHVEVHHLSRAHDVPDRTTFLLGGGGENPAEGMARTARALHASAAASGRGVTLGIPCNTFHAPPILERFLELVAPLPDFHLLDMIEATARFAHEVRPGARQVGLLSTTGTRRTAIYRRALARFDLEVIEVDEGEQDAVHRAIYDPTWGLKACSRATPRVREAFVAWTRDLTARGAEAIVLGCTEIPLAVPEFELHGAVIVDPLVALARALIRDVAPDKLAPLSRRR